MLTPIKLVLGVCGDGGGGGGGLGGGAPLPQPHVSTPLCSKSAFPAVT